MMTQPDFTDRQFLNAHVHSILAFYNDRVVDQRGGFFQSFLNNGTVHDPDVRHLVSSTRFVFNYATAWRLYGNPDYKQRACHGLKFLQTHHRQPLGHYSWTLNMRGGGDARAMAYGHAFVLLAAASACRAGITQAHSLINDVWNFMEVNFWDKTHQAYADELDETLSRLDAYRGQNANMHMCEALLAAWEATGENRYLARAQLLARRFTVELAAQTDGLIWEHYDSHWQVDLDYNIDKPDDVFKPWGFQPGHQVEWAKLLLQLNVHQPVPWLLERAQVLFQMAMDNAWDPIHGGLYYGFGPDGSVSDNHKYFWVHAEAIAAAWRLFQCTGNERYLNDYNRIWQWSWQHLIDHKYGAWFRILSADGSMIEDVKSPPGKTDYHTMGACWDVLESQH